MAASELSVGNEKVISPNSDTSPDVSPISDAYAGGANAAEEKEMSIRTDDTTEMMDNYGTSSGEDESFHPDGESDLNDGFGSDEDRSAISDCTRDGSVSDADDTDNNYITDGGQIYTSYEELAAADLAELKSAFPELRSLPSIAALPKAHRFAQLRELGLCAKEAYLATGRLLSPRDNRSHLCSAVPKGAGTGMGSMKPSELSAARELFSSLSDADIQRLFRRVTK